MSRRHSATHAREHAIASDASSGDAILARVRRLRARGDVRKALVMLREACMRDESAAVLWTIYGALQAKLGHVEDARRALKQAVWLRRSAGDAKRARSTQALLDGVSIPSAA